MANTKMKFLSIMEWRIAVISDPDGIFIELQGR